MRHYIVGVLLALLGCALIRAVITGDYQAWVAQSPILVAGGGVGLLVLAVVTLYSPQPSCDCAEQNTHQWAPWALALIVVVVAGLKPQALNPTQVSVANHAVTVKNATSGLPPLPDGTPTISLREAVARSVAPADERLLGRQVQLSGQVVTVENSRYLSRVSIICCAADARAYRVELVDPLGFATDFPDDSWVTITATLQPGTATVEREWIPLVIVGAAAETTSDGYEQSN